MGVQRKINRYLKQKVGKEVDWITELKNEKTGKEDIIYDLALLLSNVGLRNTKENQFAAEKALKQFIKKP